MSLAEQVVAARAAAEEALSVLMDGDFDTNALSCGEMQKFRNLRDELGLEYEPFNLVAKHQEDMKRHPDEDECTCEEFEYEEEVAHGR